MFRRPRRSQHCLFRRHDSRLPHLYLRASHLPCIHSHSISRHRLRRRERLLARGHNRARNPLIHIRDVGHRSLVDHRGLIIIIYHRAVNGRVRNVHVLNIPSAHAVRRHVHFTRSQRKPADRSSSAADRDSHAETTAANKRHQRWRVHRTHINYAFSSRGRRYPSPSAFHIYPTSVMKWRETPRLIINPRISPRLDIRPVAVVIRCPVRGFNAWVPHMSILRRIAPVSVVVQVFISDHILRDILSRPRMFKSAVSVGAPRVKLVVIRAQILHIRIQLICSRKHRIVMAANGIRRAPTGNLPFTVANPDRRRIAAFINIDAIDSGTRDRESQIRRVDFVRLVIVQMTHPHQNRAFAQTHLRDVVVQIQKRKTSAVGQPNRRRIQLQFDSAILVRPQFVPRSNRSIYSRIDPILRTSWLKRNGPLGIRQSCYYRWRIVIIICKHQLRKEQRERRCHSKYAGNLSGMFSEHCSSLLVAIPLWTFLFAHNRRANEASN
jgi:hypothetical protein